MAKNNKEYKRLIKNHYYREKMGGLFIYKKLLILLLTLVFIFSLSSVSADDGVNVSPDENNSQELSVDNELYEINHPPKNHHLQPDLMPEKGPFQKFRFLWTV